MRATALFSILSLVALAGCNSQPPAPPAPPPPEFRPIVSIQEIMGHVMEPNAENLWNSIETSITAKGIEEKQPRTKEDWETVRNYAITLVEGTNLLLIPNRRVTEPGAKPPEGGSDELPPEQIEARVKADPVEWTKHVHQLQDVAMLSLKAVDAQDIKGMIDAGDKLDKTCGDCHKVYWYPPKDAPKDAPKPAGS